MASLSSYGAAERGANGLNWPQTHEQRHGSGKLWRAAWSRKTFRLVLTSATSATSTVLPMDPSSVEEHRGIGSRSTVYNGRRMTRDRRPWPPRRRARGLPRALRVGRMIAIRRAGTSSHREGQGERGRGPGRAREGEGLSLQPVRLSTVHRISGHTSLHVFAFRKKFFILSSARTSTGSYQSTTPIRSRWQSES